MKLAVPALVVAVLSSLAIPSSARSGNLGRSRAVDAAPAAATTSSRSLRGASLSADGCRGFEFVWLNGNVTFWAVPCTDILCLNTTWHCPTENVDTCVETLSVNCPPGYSAMKFLPTGLPNTPWAGRCGYYEDADDGLDDSTRYRFANLDQRERGTLEGFAAVPVLQVHRMSGIRYLLNPPSSFSSMSSSSLASMSNGKPTGLSAASLSASASSSISSSSTTYEANQALKSTQRFADKVHWDSSITFRDSPYRQLHHQRGLIGAFRVRLLEATNLRRSYWSALALGPVKHLGLSRAHGAVSSYCCFDVEFQPPDGDDDIMNRHHVRFPSVMDDNNKKPAAKRSSGGGNNRKPSFTSPVVPTNDHPVWDNCQFECPLWKGSMPEDGQRIKLVVRVYEDATALENLLPGVPSSSDDARLLGVGSIDLTELCLGETVTGQSLPGIVDAWVDLELPSQQEQAQQELWEEQANQTDPMALVNLKKPSSGPANDSRSRSADNKSTGMVRVLVSYQPHGLEPQMNDVVALEAFARRNPASSSCRPLLPPLMPLVVKERQGPYLLVEYPLVDGGYRTTSGNQDKACCRLHRNAVFVIERKNLVDAAHNLALLPIDVVVSTPLGQAAIQFANPLVMASRELLMPIMLSMKLVWVAARTTTLAGLSGVQALGQTFWNEGTGSLTRRHENDPHRHLHHHDRATATAQFVSL